MKLYEYMKYNEGDYDCYDTVYDTCVTVCEIEESNDNDFYDKFCIEITKKVDFVQGIRSKYSCELICDWNKLIEDNFDKLKEFTKHHWRWSYDEDREEFIYQWIKEINAYMAGYVDMNTYEDLYHLVESLV